MHVKVALWPGRTPFYALVARQKTNMRPHLKTQHTMDANPALISCSSSTRSIVIIGIYKMALSLRHGQAVATRARPCNPHRSPLCSSRHTTNNHHQQHHYRLIAASFLDDPIDARPPSSPSPSLINADFAPVPASRRSLGVADVAALWVTLIVSVPTFLLASSLVAAGSKRQMPWCLAASKLYGVLFVFSW